MKNLSLNMIDDRVTELEKQKSDDISYIMKQSNDDDVQHSFGDWPGAIPDNQVQPI